MKREIRVLVIEDMATDVELINHELQRGGLHFRSKRVESEEELLSELEHHPPDVILSDHGIRGFDGFTALALARERRPDIPFIFVTGAHGDEVAVETIKHGADDYVLKGRLHQLVPAVTRALRGASERAQRRQLEAALQELRQQSQFLVEVASAYAIFALDPEGRIVSWNPSAERMTGFSAREAIGRDLVSFLPREDQAKGRLALRLASEQGRHEEFGWRVTRRDGAAFRAAATLAPHRDEHGHPSGLLCVLHDLTRQQQAAEEIQLKADHAVRQRATQAEADCRELQELAHSLALDLRTPLRNLDGFADLLRKHVADQLAPKNRSALETIADSARQMDRVLDELLTFTRIGQTEILHLHFGLADTVKEVISDLRRETEGRRVEWTVDELPEVIGDPALLWLVFTNLLSNALKFTRPRELARIQIRGQVTEHEVIVSVTDNGVGFDPRHRAKLFGVFQRLHPGEEFEGRGVGLANIRRIIRLHGGRTWAEGAIDQGATFYFSLPRPPVETPCPQCPDS
jgi:PAS domain S-box-containing protein